MTQEPGTPRRDDDDERDDDERRAHAAEGDLRRGAEPVDDDTSQFGGPEGGQPTGS